MMQNLASRFPALPLALGAIVGILLWRADCDWWLAALAIVLGITLMVAKLHHIAFGLYAAALGWLVADLHTPNQPPIGLCNGRTQTVTGQVLERHNTPNALVMIVRVDSVKNTPVEPFNVQIASTPDWMPFPQGERLRFSAVFNEPDPPCPLPGTTDFSAYYLINGIVATSFIDTEKVTDLGRVQNWQTRLFDRREQILDRLARSGISDDTFALLAAILLGHKDDLSPQMTENFRAVGIAHALALSGFHVGVIILLVELLLLPLRFFPRLRVVSRLLSLLLLWTYCGLVGWGISVVRAAIMYTVFLLGRTFGKSHSSLNSLCAALLIIILISPYSLWSSGLQLSVCAVAGIIAFARPLNPVSSKKQILRNIVGVLAMSVAAVFGTMLVTAAYFHSLPTLFLISNLYIALVMPLLMFGGVLLLAAGQGAVLVAALDGLTNLSNRLCDYLSTFSFNSVDAIFLDSSAVFFFAVIIITLAFVININRWKAYLVGAFVILVCAIAIPLTKSQVPDAEHFLLTRRSAQTLLLRSNDTVLLHPLKRSRRSAECDTISLTREIEDIANYLTLRRISTIIYTPDTTLSFGPYHLRRDTLLLP